MGKELVLILEGQFLIFCLEISQNSIQVTLYMRSQLHISEPHQQYALLGRDSEILDKELIAQILSLTGRGLQGYFFRNRQGKATSYYEA